MGGRYGGLPCGYYTRAHPGGRRVNFVHYPSFAAGREKWNTRKKRIDPNNLYVIVCDIDDIYEKDYRRVGRLSAAQLERLERVPCANLALLTSHKDRTQPMRIILSRITADRIRWCI